MQSVYIEHPLKRYLLNMQVLADELEARQQDHVFHNRNGNPGPGGHPVLPPEPAAPGIVCLSGFAGGHGPGFSQL